MLACVQGCTCSPTSMTIMHFSPLSSFKQFHWDKARERKRCATKRWRRKLQLTDVNMDVNNSGFKIFERINFVHTYRGSKCIQHIWLATRKQTMWFSERHYRTCLYAIKPLKYTALPIVLNWWVEKAQTVIYWTSVICWFRTVRFAGIFCQSSIVNNISSSLR